MEHESIKTQEFIEKANIMHGSRYCYDLVEYKSSKDKVKIICLIHDIFEQAPEKHLTGQGCIKCSQDRNIWKLADWELAGKKSTNFDSFKLYIIKAYNDDESFFKIGRTYLTIDTRFRNGNNQRFNYNYDIIKIITGEAKFIYDLETIFHSINHKYLYKPQSLFNGMNECYFEIDEKILKYEK